MLADSPARQPVKIGIAVSLSGCYALLGRQVLAGLKCFVDDANAAGGIVVGNGGKARAFELIAYDDQSNSHHCAKLVQQLIDDDRIDLLMGPYGSGLTLAAARVAEAANMVLWNHSGSADEIFRSDFRMLVGIISPASSYLTGVLEMLRSVDPKASRIALISAETGFAQDVASGVEKWAQRAGFVIDVHHRYRSGTSNFQSVLKSLCDDPPDCVLGVGRVEDDLQLARELCCQRPLVKAIGLVVAAIDAFENELGQDANGFLAPSQWEPDVGYANNCGPSAAEFVAAYRRHCDLPLDYPAAQGYVGGLIAQQCVATAGRLDQPALRASANDLQCTTFYGSYRIEPATGRQLAHNMLVTQWQQGRKTIVWPAAVATATSDYPGPFVQYQSRNL